MSRRSVFVFPLLTLLLLLAGLSLLARTAPAAAQTADPADLRILKYSSPTNEVQAGEQFTYTIIVDNLGPDPAQNVVITDTLVTSSAVDPNGCSIAVRTDGGAIDEFSCNFALSSGVFDLATMGSNHLNPRSPSDQGRIIVTINATANATTDLTNVATVTSDTPDPNLDNNVAVTTLSVTNAADLRILKFSSPSSEVRAGEQFTYTILVDNLGPGIANNVVITDTVITSGKVNANGCSIAVRTDGGAIDEFDCTFALSSGVFDLATMGSNHLNPRSPSDQGRIIITINATASEATDLTDVATVTSNTSDPIMDNNVAITTLSVTGVADLALQKTAVGQVQLDGESGGNFTSTPDEVSAGATLTYTLVVTNQGPSLAENVVLQDALPSALAVTTVTTSQGNCTSGQTITCGLGTLSASEVVTVSVSAQTDAGMADGTVLNNEASVSSNVFDAYNGNNLDTATVHVTATSDLWIDMQQMPQMVSRGDITYRITAGNDGASDASFALISDTLPAGALPLGWDCVAVGGASCPASGVGNLLTTVNLPVGSQVIFTLQGKVTNPQALINTATIATTTGNGDPYMANNVASVSNSVVSIHLPLTAR